MSRNVAALALVFAITFEASSALWHNGKRPTVLQQLFVGSNKSFPLRHSASEEFPRRARASFAETRQYETCPALPKGNVERLALLPSFIEHIGAIARAPATVPQLTRRCRPPPP